MRGSHRVMVAPLGCPHKFSDKRDKALWWSADRGTRGSCELLSGSAQTLPRIPGDSYKGLKANSELTPLNIRTPAAKTTEPEQSQAHRKVLTEAWLPVSERCSSGGRTNPVSGRPPGNRSVPERGIHRLEEHHFLATSASRERASTVG